MLTYFHNAVSSQKWDQAIHYIVYNRCDPNEKGEKGLSALELASNNINKLIRSLTPLEDCLKLESSRGVRGGVESINALIALGANVNQKNEAGDNALMFYLKNTELSDKMPSHKIIKLLISQGADFTPNKEKENPLDFVKENLGELVASYMQNQAAVVDPQTVSAIKIQRAWRKLHYQEQNIKSFESNSYGPRSASEIAQQFPIHPKLSLQPKTPQSDNAIDPVKAQEWINLHEGEDKILATKVLEKIDHVSFERFLFGLKESIEKWNTLIMSRPESQRNYALLLDSRDKKSIQWVTGLALPWLAHPPSQIVCLSYDELKSIKNDIHHLVIIDDAIYSGNQMTGMLDGFLQMRFCSELQHLLDKECHLIVPFISETGKKRLSEREIHVIHHETIPNFDNKGLNVDGETATYFAHKIAQEGISTINIITTGETIRRKPGIRFIPSTTEPYKST
jgi:hypothetical protein